ncbi:hypothetical protein [Rhodococcus phenolicus]|uniref:hypothetical protein n=1 Tax=Rhodococcus phenolicus TaxID=263849 RepID=UPI00082C2F1B|nr:hypothetical protein [Rhodococcus phenolicus]
MTRRPSGGPRRQRDGKAAASLLASAHRFEDPPPCTTNPALFDGLGSGGKVTQALPRWLEAERLCHQCPLLPDCRTLADGFAGVVAGRIYGISTVADGTAPSSITPKTRRAA